MEKSIIAGAILVIIIIVVAVVALTYKTDVVAPVTSTIPITAASTTVAAINQGGMGETSLAAGCTGSALFNCSNATMTQSGELSLSLASSSNATLYNIHVACMAYNGLTSMPVNASSWYALTSLGTPKPSNFTGTSLLPQGTKSIASLQCYNASGLPATLASGQAYKGTILVNYTMNDSPGSSWTTARAATININAS